MWSSSRSPACVAVVATDASLHGGGACVSTGLTPLCLGLVQTLHAQDANSTDHSPAPAPDILVVSSFDGIGG
eukprot:10417919-Prorocentrum_lima.AAC.1